MFYSAYGLLIKSDFELSPLGIQRVVPPSVENIDLRISRDTDESQDLELVDNQTCVDLSSGYYFRKNIALYRFFSGKEIKVLVLAESIDADFLRVLMNYPIACVMFQRGYFTLHASAVSFRDKVLMFCGDSLSGKSSIAAKFINLGAKLITEDSAILSFKNDAAYIAPSYPFIKLSKKIRDATNPNDNSSIQLATDRNSRLGYVLAKEKFCSAPVRVNFCFCLEWSEDRFIVEKEILRDQYKRILNSSLNIYPLNRDKERRLFSSTMTFLSLVETYRYFRKKQLSSLDNIVNHLSPIIHS